MVYNDFSGDVKRLCKYEGTDKKSICKELGMSTASMSQTLTSSILNKTFLKIVDYLGYDIVVEYRKR